MNGTTLIDRLNGNEKRKLRRRVADVVLFSTVALAFFFIGALAGSRWRELQIPKSLGRFEAFNHGTCRASWYGAEYHGRTTASGERFDMDAMTTACNFLPFGTVLRVSNQTNGKAVEVRVTDTGSFRQVFLDLSRGAFTAIADTNAGVIIVNIEVISVPAKELGER